MIPTLHVDLKQRPDRRWNIPPDLHDQAWALVRSYLADLGGLGLYRALLKTYGAAFIKPAYMREMRAVSRALSVTAEEVLLGNLYYDVIKVIFGCTAFAVDTPDGPLLARNLDWWTENNMLSDYTVITEYANAVGGSRFQTIGWPGYVGALSGVAPGRFAVTLNAVLSDDRPVLAKPISLYLRTVLETAPTFAAAVEKLRSARIAMDCLLLVVGTEPGEMVVIERTPTRSAVRQPVNGAIVVANDYRLLDNVSDPVVQELQATSCTRFDTAAACLQMDRPQTPDQCFAILSDGDVQMEITVQQMVLSARTGLCEVRLPTPASP